MLSCLRHQNHPVPGAAEAAQRPVAAVRTARRGAPHHGAPHHGAAAAAAGARRPDARVAAATGAPPRGACLVATRGDEVHPGGVH